MRHGKSLALSIGSWGGVYFRRSPIGTRLCLGWIAIDFLHMELDQTIRRLLRDVENAEARLRAIRCYRRIRGGPIRW